MVSPINSNIMGFSILANSNLAYKTFNFRLLPKIIVWKEFGSFEGT